MDKKNIIIGVLLIASAFGLMLYQTSQIEPPPEPTPPQETSPGGTGGGEGTPFEEAPSEGEDGTDAFAPVPAEGAEASSMEQADAAAPGPVAEAVTPILSNDHLRVHLTSRGGAVDKVEFLQTKRGAEDDFVFNADTPRPALGLSLEGPELVPPFTRSYELVEDNDPQQVTFVRQLGEAIEIRRTYRLAAADADGGDPYVIEHETTFHNRSDRTLQSRTGAYLQLGTMYKLGRGGQAGQFLSFVYDEGGKTRFFKINKFTGSQGFLGIGSSLPRPTIAEDVPDLRWAGVKNQFFTMVGTLGDGMQANGFFAANTRVNPPAADGAEPAPGLEDAVGGSLHFPIEPIAPGASRTLRMEVYTGPKEFRRLQALGESQSQVMQFGWFGFFSKILLFFLYGIHSVIPSWGWSIVVMTVIIKLIFWPLTAKAAQSQKRMQKIQEPLKEIREQHKDNPQKVQKETMRLFKENKVNPAAGCLPIFIQLPIFIGLFWMLRTASELRFAQFLWIQDLSRPDTVAEIAGFPLNILPLIMGATMFFQMRMTPAMASADQLQTKIFKFLPFVFLIILYNFSSGLVLYWTVQNLLTILQQYITNKRSDVANEPVVVPGSAKKKKKKSGGRGAAEMATAAGGGKKKKS